MSYVYDTENIFAKILRGEIPNDTVFETEHTLAFRDIQPLSPVHVLVIPKGAYVTYDHFAQEATDVEIIDFTRTIGKVCDTLGVKPHSDTGGYRMLANSGSFAGQEVPHLHVHIFAGRKLGPMLKR